MIGQADIGQIDHWMMIRLKIFNDTCDTLLTCDIDILVSKHEIEHAIRMLQELLDKEELPNEAIFLNDKQLVTVSKTD